VPERVVFDTNVWISGLLWRGRPYRCLLLAHGKVVEAVYCDPMAAELSEKLRSRFGFSENRIHAAIYDLRRAGTRVNITGNLHIVTDDPDDDKFIVSGDHHLLRLGKYGDVTILTATDFLERDA
jgi:putative PIN family toxin of toxin-antitoxin system